MVSLMGLLYVLLVVLMPENGLVVGPHCDLDGGEWACCRSSL